MFCAANHFCPQLASFCEVPTRLLVKELPKTSNILFQLPHNEIGAVAAEIFHARRIERVQQACTSCIRFQQRPIGYFSVLVTISEEELTQRHYVRVFQLSARRLPLLVPVDLRLTNAVPEVKWFVSVEIAGTKRGHFLECITPGVTLGILNKRIELFRFCKEHH